MENKDDLRVKNGGLPPSVGEFAVEDRQRLLAKVEEQARKIAALKARPSGVVLPAKYADDTAYGQGRDDAIDEVARLNSSPVSSGDPEKCSYQDDPRSPAELSLAGCNCVRFGEGNPHWPCKLHTPVSACGVDERAAFEAWRLEKFCGGVERLKKCSNAPDVYYYTAEQEAWTVWQARAALTAPAPNHGEQVRHMVPVCTTCNGVGIVGHSTLCPECAAAPSAGSQGGDV
jgi:hypothetical protein